MAEATAKLQNRGGSGMSRPPKAPRALKNTKEELRPRGARSDPRADPVTSPPPPLSRPPLSSPPHGRDEPGGGARDTSERKDGLEEQYARTEAALRDSSVEQIRRIAVLEHEALRHERQIEELEARLAEKEGSSADLARERTEHAARVAELETSIAKDAEEMLALKERAERVAQENAALEASCRRERAAKEDLTAQVASLEALLAKIKVLLT
jgi:DNA repair exonuclease SbcCD ATPase subunit